MPRLITSGALSVLAMSASLMGGSLASAQTTSSTGRDVEPSVTNDQSGSGQLGEIVVTANKRGENIQKVGISVTAFSGQQLHSGR